MRLFRRKTKRKACVIGLDGVPHSLLVDLAGRGILPHLQELIQAGHLHRMKASLPEISAVSWTDFMTGVNSGSHGIFGFTDLKPGTYDVRFPNFLDLRRPTIWDVLGQSRKKSVVINQPSTYPARQIPGILISGFVAIDLTKAVFPPSFIRTLERLDYQIDIDTSRSRHDHAFLWKELQSSLQARQRAFRTFWQEDWDFFEFVITGTDRLHHFLWDAGQNPDHPHHASFLDYYRQIDETVHEISTSFAALTGGLEGLFLLSDHGFTGIEQEVFLNAWLEQLGFLSFESSSPQELSDIEAASRAFAMDPGRIYINLKERFPKGCVTAEDRSRVKQDIQAALTDLEYDGKKVVRTVFDAEEIYSGPFVSLGPDLLVLPECGFDMKGSVKKKEVFSRSDLQGMHTWDDAFFWAMKDCGKDLSIVDLQPLIVEALG